VPWTRSLIPRPPTARRPARAARPEGLGFHAGRLVRDLAGLGVEGRGRQFAEAVDDLGGLGCGEAGEALGCEAAAHACVELLLGDPGLLGDRPDLGDLLVGRRPAGGVLSRGGLDEATRAALEAAQALVLEDERPPDNVISLAGRRQ